MGRCLWIAAAVAHCAACGGETEGSGATPLDRCGAASACGGDLTGSWAVESYCASLTELPSSAASDLPPECDTAYRQSIATLVIDPIDTRLDFDGTQYQFSGTARMSFTFNYDPACFRALSGGVSLDARYCSALNDEFQADPDSPGSCTYVGNTCRCSVSSIRTMDSSGAYETVDTELRTDGESTGGPYCVEGTRATIDVVSAEGNGRLQLRR